MEDRARIAAIVTRDVAPVEVQEVANHVGFFQSLRDNLYDLVITEQDLHWSSGQEVLNAVKSLRPAVPVIMVAGQPDESLASAAFRDGLDAYVAKSGDLDVRLRTSLRSALRRLEFEERIDGLEDRIEHLLDRLDVAVFRSSAEGELLEVNAAFARLLGPVRPEDGEPRQLRELFQDGEAWQELTKLLSAEGQVQNFEAVLRRTDGVPRWTRINLTRRRIAGGLEVIDGLAEDITAARDARRAVEEARDELRSVFEHSGAAIVVLEADGTIAMVNTEFERFSGVSRRDLEGVEVWQRFTTLAQGDHIADRRRLLLAAPESGPRSGTFDFIGRDGRARRVHATETALPDGRRSVVSLVDVSERRRVEDQLLHNAFHDGLTGLPNRLSLFERLTALQARPSWRSGGGAVLIVLDIDRFKEVNDRYGHRIGDHLLRAVTRRIEGALPDRELLARCGSDSFALLLYPVAEGDGGPQAAETILRVIREPFRFGDQSIACSASVGLARAGRPEEVASLFRDAETAMYEARRTGGGRAVESAKPSSR